MNELLPSDTTKVYTQVVFNGHLEGGGRDEGAIFRLFECSYAYGARCGNELKDDIDK